MTGQMKKYRDSLEKTPEPVFVKSDPNQNGFERTYALCKRKRKESNGTF